MKRHLFSTECIVLDDFNFTLGTSIYLYLEFTLPRNSPGVYGYTPGVVLLPQVFGKFVMDLHNVRPPEYPVYTVYPGLCREGFLLLPFND